MTQKSTQEIEADVSKALAADFEATTGDQGLVVVEHVSAAVVLLPSGETKTMWTATEGLAEYALLGLTDWLYLEARA